MFASIAIPGVFPPLRRDGQVLADGGLVAPVPVRAVRALSGAPVVAVNLLGDYAARGQGHFPSERQRLTLSGVSRAGLSLITSHVARQALLIDPPDLEIVPAIGHVDPTDFTRAGELIAAGEDAVAAAWDRIMALR